MKKMRKIAAVILALVMCLTMAVPAMAATITINGGPAGSKYGVYKLLNATVSADKQNIAYTVNEKYLDILQAVTGKVKGTEIIEYIEGIKDNDSAVRKFADDVYEKIRNTEPAPAADYTVTAENENAVIEDVNFGYYLAVESATGSTDDSYTLAILNTAGITDFEMTVKEEEPTLDKKIQHDETGEWGVVGDNAIGDTVHFRITTTVPANTDVYDEYIYRVTDNMDTSLSPVLDGENIKVTVKVNDTTELSKDYYVVNGTNPFTINVDVKKAIREEKLHADDTLYYYYDAVLNDTAVIYDAGNQVNKAYLEYSNNPYDEGLGKSTEKTVYDWTFKMDVNKVDGENNNLTGAEFVLTTAGKAFDVEAYLDDPTKTDDLIPLVDEGDGVYRVATPEDDDVVYVISAGNVTIKGLNDETEYLLYETKAPDGFNRKEEATRFTISADYNQDGNNLSGNQPTAVIDSVNSTSLSTDVINQAGSLLPSTGGIGTTIFYVVGICIIVVVGVLLVTRKRMNRGR